MFTVFFPTSSKSNKTGYLVPRGFDITLNYITWTAVNYITWTAVTFTSLNKEFRNTEGGGGGRRERNYIFKNALTTNSMGVIPYRTADMSSFWGGGKPSG